jgi:hypothetical protein
VDLGCVCSEVRQGAAKLSAPPLLRPLSILCDFHNVPSQLVCNFLCPLVQFFAGAHRVAHTFTIVLIRARKFDLWFGVRGTCEILGARNGPKRANVFLALGPNAFSRTADVRGKMQSRSSIIQMFFLVHGPMLSFRHTNERDPGRGSGAKPQIKFACPKDLGSAPETN